MKEFEMIQNNHERSSCILCGSHLAPRFFYKKNNFNILQCPSCQLVFVDNPPSLHDIEKLYSLDSDYHVQFLFPNRDLEKKALTQARKKFSVLKKYASSGKLMDVGCSVGFFLRIVKEEGWKACGLEVSAHTAKFAKEKYGLQVFNGTLEKTTLFPPSTFDVITMWDVIEHTSNPLESIEKAYTLLKKDGLIFLSTPNIDGLFPRLSYMASKLISFWPHPDPPHHLFCFSKKTLVQLLKRTGFVPIKIIDKIIPLSYTFGDIKAICKSPLRLLYALFFTPVVLLGVLLHSGDSMIIVAKKDPSET